MTRPAHEIVKSIKFAVESDITDSIDNDEAIKYLWNDREKMYELLEVRNDDLRNKRIELQITADQGMKAITQAAEHERAMLLAEAITERLTLRAKKQKDTVECLRKACEVGTETAERTRSKLLDARAHIANLLDRVAQAPVAARRFLDELK